jgi:hypothetical protein
MTNQTGPAFVSWDDETALSWYREEGQASYDEREILSYAISSKCPLVLTGDIGTKRGDLIANLRSSERRSFGD